MECVIRNNSITSDIHGDGSGLYSNDHCYPTLTDFSIIENLSVTSSGERGAGFYFWAQFAPSLTSCVESKNTGRVGAGLSCSNS